MPRGSKRLVGKHVQVPRAQNDRFNKRLGPNRAPPRPGLEARIKESVEKVRDMSPDQLADMMRMQAASMGRSAMPRDGESGPAGEMPLLVLPAGPLPDFSQYLTDPRAEIARRSLRKALAGQPDIESLEDMVDFMQGCVRSALDALDSRESQADLGAQKIEETGAST